MKRALITGCSALLFCGTVLAKTIAGVELPNQAIIDNTSINYQGAGVRTKFFMKLYVASLYGSGQAEAMLSGQQPAMIQLDILSGLITSENMKTTIEEGFQQSAGAQFADLKPKIQTLMAAFDGPISEGDRFQIRSFPGQPVELHKNGQPLTAIEGDAFREALLGIWLGSKPVSGRLKSEMLGQI
ncbi:MAG: chalcone isomerase family protein [Ferrimonas sp.]